jgi:hypothetical protein
VEWFSACGEGCRRCSRSRESFTNGLHLINSKVRSDVSHWCRRCQMGDSPRTEFPIWVTGKRWSNHNPNLSLWAPRIFGTFTDTARENLTRLR